MPAENESFTKPNESPEEAFVKFHYAEVKDLAKQFLTLISGTLVLTVSFADKIVPISEAHTVQKWLMGVCWLSLLVAFVLAGLGIYTNYLAAEQARGAMIYDYQTNFQLLARRAYRFLDFAGILFTVSLAFLALTGIVRLFLQ